MLTSEALHQRREVIGTSSDLLRLRERLSARAGPVLQWSPEIPEVKALLSVDGGFCPNDGAGLEYDPWSPHRHRCPRCGNAFEGERHHRWWARLQHLWLGERMAHLAALAAFDNREDAAAGAKRLLTAYGNRYLDYPNSDNVLGPARLFFSTYLESIWITNVIAAGTLLRSADLLDQTTEHAVSHIAEEAAGLIGEFNEGFSNRQTWHNAALAAIGVWFDDDELLQSVVAGPTGLLPHLVRGFGDDGMWYEGENYHLFALRGLLTGLDWVSAAGIAMREDPALARRLAAALRAPTLSALPDLTFPARKDSRFGVSLAQPMYLEIWEAGLASTDTHAADLTNWLSTLYAAPAPAAQSFDSYLHEAGEPVPPRRGREDLSWWMLARMLPVLENDHLPRAAPSALLASQGLAILRHGNRYASLECGILGGGHGHPDRLHLTLHQDGCHWLPDPGAGSYVTRDLFWYRSTLAHNAPRLDGVSQTPGDAICEYFEAREDWGWVRGQFGEMTRTLVSGPDHLLDVVELAADEERVLELPWHLAGDVAVLSPGAWEAGVREDEFVSGVERFVFETTEPIALRVRARDSSATLSLQLHGVEELIRATGPGVPGSGPAPFLLVRSRGRNVRVAAAIASGETAPVIQASGDQFLVTTARGTTLHRPTDEGWAIESNGRVLQLGGKQPAPSERSLASDHHEEHARAFAVAVAEPPPLDGSRVGFEAEPLLLDSEDQYRRSEEPYLGPDEFSARAYAAWNETALYLAVEVDQPDLIVRAPDAAPLRLDNEIDDIHSDGLQVYVQAEPDAPVYGFVIVPVESEGTVRVRGAGNTAGRPEMLRGAWRRTDRGYAVTLALGLPDWQARRMGDAVRFDLLVNQMRPGRERRAGQLVWSGGNGWIWLRGDRQDPARFGVLELR